MFHYSHKQIRQIFPWIKPRTLISWSERSLIKPNKDAFGRGTRRLYLYDNLLEIAFADELLQFGMHFGMIQMMIGEFQNEIKKKNYDFVFVIYQNKDLYPDSGPWREWAAMALDKYIKTNLFNSDKRTTTSVMVINVKEMKGYIDNRLKEIFG